MAQKFLLANFDKGVFFIERSKFDFVLVSFNLSSLQQDWSRLQQDMTEPHIQQSKQLRSDKLQSLLPKRGKTLSSCDVTNLKGF